LRFGSIFELQFLRSAITDVAEGEQVDVFSVAWLDRSDQADATLVRQRENGQEIGFIEVSVQVLLNGGPSPATSAT
jgi:hypothetical protein